MTNGKGFSSPILDNPLEPYQDEKIREYLEGVDVFPKFLGAPKVEKIQKGPKRPKKPGKVGKQLSIKGARGAPGQLSSGIVSI